MRASSTALAVLIGLGAAIGAIAAPASSSPPSLVQAYKSFCYDTRAEAKPALARAGAAGWRAPVLPPAGAPPGLSYRSKQVGATHFDLMVGSSETPAGPQFPFPTRLRVCIVAASPRRVPVHKAMRALIGADPISRQGPTWGWGFSEAGGRRDFKPPATPAEAAARASQGSMVIIDARETDRGSALGFTRVTRAGR